MADKARALANLREYANRIKETVYDTDSSRGKGVHEAKLDATLQFLQEQVKQQEAAIEKVQANSSFKAIDEPAQDPKSRLHQIRIVTAAYKSLTSIEPDLPPANSVLPALLALRNTLSLVEQTKISIALNHENLLKARERLHQEQADLRDANLLLDALQMRVENVEIEYQEKSQQAPEEAAKGLIRKQQQRKTSYEQGMKRLIRAFNKFVDETLNRMLAVEELGGPVVGDLIDIDDGVIEAGFNNQGKAKKVKPTSSNKDTKRQQRIDEIWGSLDEDDEPETERRSEKEAAGAEFRSLTEDLLNAAAGDEGSGTYVDLPRDSAAARFLVRAKVAQFHPRDARRLRLLAFGRELDE